MRIKVLSGGAALFACAIVAACASSGTSAVPVPVAPTDVSQATTTADPCMVVPQPDTPRESVTVVVEVRDRPWLSLGDTAATARASAFAIAQQYNPIMRVTCEGRVVPVIAERWTAGSLPGEQRIQLRSDAHFSNGAIVTAGDVTTSWRSRAAIPGAAALGQMPALGSLVIDGERAFVVRLMDSQSANPFVFGELSLAVSRNVSGRGWPLGGGQFAADTVQSRQGVLILRPTGARARPTLVVREDSTRDQRDLLDRGVDILQTRDPAVVDYARRGMMGVHPLPFDRSYVLAIPSLARSNGLGVRDSAVHSEAAAFRSSLARDVVRGEARAAELPSWWMGEMRCPDWGTSAQPGVASNVSPSASRAIAYEANDPVARALAERIVAIARSAGSNANEDDAKLLLQLLPELNVASARTLSAVAANENSLREQTALAYVVHLPTRVLDRCMRMRGLVQRAAWLSPAAFFPLVETRSWLVARPGAPAVTVDWDGTLRVLPSLPPRGNEFPR